MNQYISIRDWTDGSSSRLCYTNTVPYFFIIFECFPLLYWHWRIYQLRTVEGHIKCWTEVFKSSMVIPSLLRSLKWSIVIDIDQYDQVISWYVFQPYCPGLLPADLTSPPINTEVSTVHQSGGTLSDHFVETAYEKHGFGILSYLQESRFNRYALTLIRWPVRRWGARSVPAWELFRQCERVRLKVRANVRVGNPVIEAFIERKWTRQHSYLLLDKNSLTTIERSVGLRLVSHTETPFIIHTLTHAHTDTHKHKHAHRHTHTHASSRLPEYVPATSCVLRWATRGTQPCAS